MSNPAAWMDLVDAIDSYAVNAIWQVPLVAAAAWVVNRMVRKMGPQTQHRVWVSALVLAVVMPAVPVRKIVAMIPARQAETATTASVATVSVATAADDVDMSALPVMESAPETVEASKTAAGVMLVPRVAALALLFGYLGTGLYFALRLGWSLLLTWRLMREARELELTPERARVWARCRESFGVERAELLASEKITGPVTMGVRRPVLMAPMGFAARCSDDELLAALAHECAHMRRRDFAKNVAYEAASVLVAFHPVTWMVKAQVAETREMVCDGAAAERLMDRQSYVQALLRLAGWVAAGRALPAVGIFDGKTLERRVLMMKMRRREMGWAMRGTMAATAAVVMLGAASLSGWKAVEVQAKAEPVVAPMSVGVDTVAGMQGTAAVSAASAPVFAGVSNKKWLGEDAHWMLGQQTATPVGQQALMPGMQILSDTQGVDFNGYLQNMLAVIKRNWEPLLPDEVMAPTKVKGVTGIRFAILPDGRIGSMVLETKSGDAALDKAAWGAITSQGKFDALPAAFHGPNLELRIGFYVNEQPQAGGPAASELKDEYKKWLDEDVRGVITDQERAAFEALKNDEERDKFQQEFWARRGGATTEDEHYRRIAYANEHYGYGSVPGWRSDRGMIYIKFGKPDSIDQHTMVTADGSFKGPGVYPVQQKDGQTVTFPFEVWHYKTIAGIGDNIDIEFVDQCQCGEFRTTLKLPSGASAAPPAGGGLEKFVSLMRPPASGQFRGWVDMPSVAASVMTVQKIAGSDTVRLPDSMSAYSQGRVILDVVVAKDGTVKDALALEGPEALRQMAVDAVKTWRYKPYLQDGAPAEVQTRVQVIFALEGLKAQARTQEGVMEDVIRAADRRYPAIAKAAHVQGMVVVQGVEGVDGTITNLQVLSGPEMLRPAALEIAKSSGFKRGVSAEFDGPMHLRITMLFDLGDAANARPQQGISRTAGLVPVGMVQKSAAAGKGTAAPAPAKQSATGQPRLHNAMVYDLISSTDPQYPPIAKAAHVEGRVLLHGRLTKDGVVTDLQAVDGPEMLKQAAIDTIKAWKPNMNPDGPAGIEQHMVVFDWPLELRIFVNFDLNAPAMAQGHEPQMVMMMEQQMTNGTGVLAEASLERQYSSMANMQAEVKRTSMIHLDSGILAGMKTGGASPVYPPIAKAAHVTGAVVVHVAISPEGKVTTAQAVSGPNMLQQAAVDAVKTWTYKPYLIAGRAVAVEATVTVNFALGWAPPVCDPSKQDCSLGRELRPQGVMPPPQTAQAKLQPAALQAAAARPASAANRPVPISGGVMAGAKISGSDPAYPPIARAAHVQGSVVLHALISKEGSVTHLDVVSGPNMLQQAALDAVWTWKYKPYLLQGAPRDADTTVTVNFTMNGDGPSQAEVDRVRQLYESGVISRESYFQMTNYAPLPQAGSAEPAAAPGVYRIGGDVSPPQVIHVEEPKYPEQARAEKFNGNVLVTLVVDAQGMPQNVRVIQGVGMGLDEKAIEAVKQYKFKPAMRQGQPVAVALNIEVNFEIF